MKILHSCSHISTIVWLHRLSFDEMPGEKARWKLHKDTACCFEQILEVTYYKTATEWLLTFDLKVHCKGGKDITHEQCSFISPTHGYICIGWSVKTYIHQLYMDTGCHLEDLLKEISNKDGWWLRVKGTHVVSMF